MAITRNSIEGHRNATLVAQKGAYAFERQLFVRRVAMQNKAYHQRDLNGVQGSRATRGNLLVKAIRVGDKSFAPSHERGEGNSKPPGLAKADKGSQSHILASTTKMGGEERRQTLSLGL